MIIDFSANIHIRGVVVQFAEGKNATLGEACRLALIAPDANKLTVDKVVERGRLALSLADGGKTEITPEQLSLVRGLLPNAFSSPELVVVVYDMLNPVVSDG